MALTLALASGYVVFIGSLALVGTLQNYGKLAFTALVLGALTIIAANNCIHFGTGSNALGFYRKQFCAAYKVLQQWLQPNVVQLRAVITGLYERFIHLLKHIGGDN